MEEQKLFEKKKVFFDYKVIEEDKKKAKKRVDIAAKLILLREAIKGKDEEKTINSILIRLKDYTGGLLPSEIKSINLISRKYSLIEKIERKLPIYKSEYLEYLKKYECPAVGASKLSVKSNNILENFAHSLKLPFSKKDPTKRKYRDIIIKYDLYHRDHYSKQVQDKISEYTWLSRKQLEENPILINQNNELLDGYLRLQAMKRIMKNTEDFDVYTITIQTKDDNHLKQLMYRYNNQHGEPIKLEKKKEYAEELKKNQNLSDDEIAKIVGVSRQTINNWTQKVKISQSKKQKDNIFDLRKKGLTQTEIAQKTGISQATVSNIINNANDSKTNKSTLVPAVIFPTNYWNFNKGKESQLSKAKHVGKTPEIYLENLLYYHTIPTEVVVDFFAGAGTTWDVSDRMGRVCYCYDRAPIGGKEHIIKKWDVKDGLPKTLPKTIDFVYLDPPYWSQAEGVYSTNLNDLGNMTLKKFNRTMQNLFDSIKKIKVKKLAFIINPTIYKEGKFIFVDHTFDFHDMIKDEYNIIARYALTSPAKSLKTLIKIAKESHKCLIYMRDLVVYERES